MQQVHFDRHVRQFRTRLALPALRYDVPTPLDQSLPQTLVFGHQPYEIDLYSSAMESAIRSIERDGCKLFDRRRC